MIEQPTALLRVGDVARRLAVSRSKAYELLVSGQLASVRIGRSRRVKAADLDQFIETLERP